MKFGIDDVLITGLWVAVVSVVIGVYVSLFVICCKVIVWVGS